MISNLQTNALPPGAPPGSGAAHGSANPSKWKDSAVFRSAHVEWGTPPDLKEALNKEFAFDLDPCTPGQTWDGREIPWGGQWCKFCNKYSGIAEYVLNLANGKTLQPMPSKEADYQQGISTESENERRVRLVVQGVSQGSGARKDEIAPPRPGGIKEDFSREEKALALNERQGIKTPTKRNLQSQTETEKAEYKMGLDTESVAEMQSNLEQPMRLLQPRERGINPRSLHSSGGSKLSRNGAKQHGPGLSKVQYEQAASQPVCMVQEKGSTCSYCGRPTAYKGFRVFVNPPYGRGMGKWLAKGPEADVAVFLIPARTDTAWFHDYAIKSSEIRFFRGRLKFLENHVSPRDGQDAAPFPSMLVIYKRQDSPNVEPCNVPSK